MEPIPNIGDIHNFFDDGKIRESRHYTAKIIEIITPEDAKQIKIDRHQLNQHDASLYEIWRHEVNDHRTSKNFIVLGKGVSSEPGSPWCYAENTDFFIKCSIPDYEDDDVWFVRHVDGGWFSLNTANGWMSGRLMPFDFDWDNINESYLL